MNIGYARTSTGDQTAALAAQQRGLKAWGCEKIFAEQASNAGQGKRLTECLAYLRDGDVLTVTKPDRLARAWRGGRDQRQADRADDCRQAMVAVNASTRSLPRSKIGCAGIPIAHSASRCWSI
jgi:DNA invertase Pin-like site-specific DNA recombinase